MRKCKNCGHEIRRQKGIYKHRMTGYYNLKQVVYRIRCANNVKDSFKVCHCEKPESEEKK